MVAKTFYVCECIGVNTASRQRYRAEAMAFWLHLVPKLHRRDNFKRVFRALDVNSTEDAVSITTTSTTELGDRSLWMSSGPDEQLTSDDGLLMMDSATGTGSRLLLATLVVGGTLLIVNCVVFIAMLCHRLRRFKHLTTTKPVPYVKQPQFALFLVFIQIGPLKRGTIVNLCNKRPYKIKTSICLRINILHL